MDIVPYSELYRDDVITIINNFYAEALSAFSRVISIPALEATIQKYKEDSFLLIIDNKCEGIIAGTRANSPLNNDKVYQEMIWYINKKSRHLGVLMMIKVEAVLKEKGYTQLIMALIHGSKEDKLGRFYERNGFKPFETHYLKNL